MSDIFLNYVDARALFSKITAASTQIREIDDAGAAISAALGLSLEETMSRLKVKAVDREGIELSYDSFYRLCILTADTDLGTLKSVPRLNLICRAFGRRADAMMHYLKSTTGTATNPTLKEQWPNAEDIWNTRSERERWFKSFENGPGLYVISGPPGNGLTQVMRAIITTLDPTGECSSAIPLHRGFDGMPPPEDEFAELERASPGASLLYGAVRNDEELSLAIRFAQKRSVVITFYADTPKDVIHFLKHHSNGLSLSRAIMSIRRFYTPSDVQNSGPTPSVTAKAIIDQASISGHTRLLRYEKATPVVYAVQDLYSRDLISLEQMARFTETICKQYKLPDDYFEPLRNQDPIIRLLPFTQEKSRYQRQKDV